MVVMGTGYMGREGESIESREKHVCNLLMVIMIKRIDDIYDKTELMVIITMD